MTERPADASPLDLSVAIITFNEEANLARCLASLPPGCDIIVMDSGSVDATEAIALSYRARFFHRPFTDYASQKNAAIAEAKRKWVLCLDADEELDATLSHKIATLCQADSPFAAFRLHRQLVFMGRRMRFGKSADRPLRLFQRGCGHYEGAIHEKLVVKGRVATLTPGRLFHYSYRDLSDYFARFNRYTSRIADEHAAAGRNVAMARHLIRPWSEFFLRYVVRLGFLDGYPGYCYALLSSLYTFVKYAKLKERTRLESR